MFAASNMPGVGREVLKGTWCFSRGSVVCVWHGGDWFVGAMSKSCCSLRSLWSLLSGEMTLRS